MNDKMPTPQMPDRMHDTAAPPSEMRQRLAETDWSKTPLGPMAGWSESLKANVGLIMASGFPMGMRWGPALTYIYNDAFISILGARHPHAFGGNIDDPIWDDIGGDLRPLSRAIMRGEHPGLFARNHVWRNRRYGVPEDARFTLSYSPVPDPTAPHGVGGVLLTAIETTEESYAEQRLRYLTQKLEEEVAQRTQERDRIWQVSEDLLAVGNFEGYYTSLNPAWTALLGWSEEELKRMHVDELRHPDDAPAANEQRALLAAGAPAVRMENRFRHKDGSWRWLNWTLAAHGGLLYVIGRHITADREAAERLRESERNFRSLVGALTDYAIFKLSPDGIVSSWNAGAERAKGYKSEEILGQHFQRFYTPEDQNMGLPGRLLAQAAAEGRAEAEGWRVRKDGSRFWANVVIDAIYEDGKLVGFAKFTRDISERRETQIQLAQTQEHLAQAQKMDALGQLTGGIAHDFNNMLMVVGGYAQFLKQRLSDPKDKRAIDAIEFAAGRAENLTRQLLTFSRRQSLNRTTVRLHECFAAFHDILATTAKGNIKLDVRVPEDTWPVTIDVNEFEVAIINLMVNARDAMPGGGDITITARNETIAEHYNVNPLTGDYVVIDIADQGVGIAPEIMPKVFDPFFTTKETDKGTGLGLSQVYGFAHQAGGTVRLTSKVGAGTTVAVYLPRSQEAVSDLRDEHGAGVPGGDETVLLVEDNAEVQAIAKTMLEQLGYKVITADSATRALSVLEINTAVDLVLTDIVMPGPLDGMALAHQVARDYPQLPVLLSTGYARAVSDPHGPFMVLRKPYQLPALARAVRHALDVARIVPA